MSQNYFFVENDTILFLERRSNRLRRGERPPDGRPHQVRPRPGAGALQRRQRGRRLSLRHAEAHAPREGLAQIPG